MAYRSVGVVANLQRPDVPETVLAAIAWLQERSALVRVEAGLDRQLGLDVPPFEWEALAGQLDLLLTFGGDGTLLYAARRLAGQDVPLFGVNTGSLGFLTSSSRESMIETFERVFSGEAVKEPYMTLRARLARSHRADPSTPTRPDAAGSSGAGSGATPVAVYDALNDVVLHKGAVTARVLDLRLEVDGDEVGTYVADGFILSTPAGSTGYSLSANGPLVVPTMAATVATPICPHTLAIRPLVLPPEAEIRVTVLDLEEPASLAVDGVVVAELRGGDVVSVTRGPHRVTLVRLPGRSFFRLLRSKLHWGGRAEHE